MSAQNTKSPAQVIGSMPPIAVIVLIAAAAELILARLLWYGLYGMIDEVDVRQVGQWARLPRNLAAVAGIVTLCFALVSFLRSAGYASIARRLTVAAFSGVILPALLVATFLPRTAMREGLVDFASAAGGVIVALVTLTAVHYRSRAGVRVAVGLAGWSATASLFIVFVHQLQIARGGILGWIAVFCFRYAEPIEGILHAVQQYGEVAWLGALVAAAAGTVWVDRNKRWLVIGTVACAAGVAGFLALRLLFDPLELRVLVYGSFHVELLLDDAPWFYALPLGAGLASAIVAFFRPATRQLGAGTFLWLAAGYAPQVPIRLLYLVLAAILWTRAAQASDSTSGWEQRQPWARLLGRKATSA